MTFTTPNITGLPSVFTYANSVTGNAFGNILIIAVWITLFLIAKAFSSERALVAASFLTLMFAFPLIFAGFVSAQVLIILGLMVAGGALMSI